MATVSIVIPNFNHGAYLSEAIESSLLSTNRDLEVIVVDDGSTDSSLAIAAAWTARDRRVHLVRNESNCGPEYSLNRGLELATGEGVLFRAADDISTPGFIDTAVDLLDAYPQAAYCLGDTRFFSTDPRSGRLQPAGIATCPMFVAPERWNADFGGSEISTCSALVRRSKVSEFGGFDRKLRWVSDWAILAALGLQDGFVYLPVPACVMRMSATSYNSAGTRDDAIQRAIFRELLERWSRWDDARYTQLRRSQILDLFTTSLQHLAPSLHGELSMRARALLEVIELPPPSARNRCGIPGALRSFVHEQRASLAATRALGILGAGGHTRMLLEAWREEKLPEPRLVMQSSPPDSPEFCGLPAVGIDDVQPDAFDAVVISSKSYEPELASLAWSRFPQTPLIRIWN